MLEGNLCKTLFMLLVSAFAVAVQQAPAPQFKVPRTSQKQVVTQTVGFTDITITYARPGVKGRTIFGGLVPYDVIWRAGANEPTSITFSTPVKVEGQDVPAGTYSLFLIPGHEQWTLILSKFTGGWGTYSYDQGEVRSAGQAILERLGVTEEQRLKPRILSEQTITGISGHHAALIDRMRHGDMITEGQTLYTLEVHPAAYAGIAANEAEKAAPIHLLEVITFGAVGRLWLGGYEAEIAEAARAIRHTLDNISGRDNKA